MIAITQDDRDLTTHSCNVDRQYRQDQDLPENVDQSMHSSHVAQHDFQDPDRSQCMQDCTVVDQHLRDPDQDRIVQNCSDFHHMYSRWQRVALLMHDKWSADENIMLRWQLVAKVVNAKMGVYDPHDMGSRWGRLALLMRNRKY